MMLKFGRSICQKCMREGEVAFRQISSKGTTGSAQLTNTKLVLYRKISIYRPLPIVAHAIRQYSSLKPHYSNKLLSPRGLQIYGATPNSIPIRQLSIGGVVRGILKIRYILLGTAVGSGVAISQTIEGWKQYLPDIEKLKTFLPDDEAVAKWQTSLRRLGRGVVQRARELPDFYETSKQKALEKIPSWEAFQKWLEEEAENDPTLLAEGLGGQIIHISVPDAGSSLTVNQQLSAFGVASVDEASSSHRKSKGKMEEMQDEFLASQLQYQKEIDRLEKENRDLRKQLLLKGSKTKQKRKMKKALIDMYSEVLDELQNYDSSYNTQDHLPRVVVVGDQSSGKTSVLEMIAQARIFPRGSGEMMTRAPVKVTLSEGPYHIASFKDSNREYDLTKESELEALRKDVEKRMKASVPDGQTISCECISMTVKGPGLPRMVLVDLPGIISTVTTDLASDTRDRIQKLCMQYMENPNAIILCIQDGSLDAERSNVTNFVSGMDPSGKRTIFVLTKVDLAERQLYNPQRIQRILEGRLFPMKALGYFAVVTGRGNTEDSISVIKEYEESFFKSSKLFKEGVMRPHQMTTHNLSQAVSECFWKMVRESVEQQADAFKATRFNLETEWKNTFPRVRELDREELFEKARGDILDEIINLSQVTPHDWENAFTSSLWENMSTHVFENIYLPAAEAESAGVFNTAVDIRLKQWADKQLPKKCVDVGMETLKDQFGQLLERGSSGEQDIFKHLKTYVREEGMSKHKWDMKAEDSLRVLQINSLEDRTILDKHQWDLAVKFMEEAVKDKLTHAETQLREMTGPSGREQWMYWRSKTDEQRSRCSVIKELEKLLANTKHRKPQLYPDELTTVRKNLEGNGVLVENEFIRETWHHVYRKHFLTKALSTANDCKKGFFYYQKGFSDNGLDCHDVILFWRIQRMLQVTSNALRQQVMNNEARRLERNIKDVLSDIGDDYHKLQQLLTGKRVQLAEELKKVRQIQDLLEEFIRSLNSEKP